MIEGVKVADVVPYIDWNPFFQTWELRGRYPNRGYPKIFDDETVGGEAKKLFDDAQKMMKEIIADGSMTLKGVCALYPAWVCSCALPSLLLLLFDVGFVFFVFGG